MFSYFFTANTFLYLCRQLRNFYSIIQNTPCTTEDNFHINKETVFITPLMTLWNTRLYAIPLWIQRNS